MDVCRLEGPAVDAPEAEELGFPREARGAGAGRSGHRRSPALTLAAALEPLAAPALVAGDGEADGVGYMLKVFFSRLFFVACLLTTGANFAN